MVNEWRSASGIILLMIFAAFIGLKFMKKNARQDKICYLVLLAWCAYIPVSSLFHWVPLTTAALRQLLYSPIGTWMENVIFKLPH